MWTSLRRSGATPVTRSQRVGVAVALLACIGLSACAAADSPAPASSAEAPAATPLPASGELEPGTYLVTSFTVPFEITVPEGWESGEWFIYKDGSVFVAVNFQAPGYVPTDACLWRGALAEVDPSPEAFAEAMVAQTSTETTDPVRVMVGDFSALEFDHWVANDIDISTCDEAHICLHTYQANACDRWHDSVNEHETYRVFDLNGERAVIAVLESGVVEPALTAEARAVFDSIEFAPGG